MNQEAKVPVSVVKNSNREKRRPAVTIRQCHVGRAQQDSKCAFNFARFTNFVGIEVTRF
jgi:hypothetical protein